MQVIDAVFLLSVGHLMFFLGKAEVESPVIACILFNLIDIRQFVLVWFICKWGIQTHSGISCEVHLFSPIEPRSEPNRLFWKLNCNITGVTYGVLELLCMRFSFRTNLRLTFYLNGISRSFVRSPVHQNREWFPFIWLRRSLFIECTGNPPPVHLIIKIV